jgi:hypothetical protein
VVEGSGAIIDWAERRAADRGRTLGPDAKGDEVASIEQRADAVIGIHMRRLACAALLPAHADVMKRAMFQSAEGWHRVAGDFTWPLVWQLIVKSYDIGPGAAADSRAKLEADLIGSTASWPAAAPILPASASAAPTSSWRACSGLSLGRGRFRSIARWTRQRRSPPISGAGPSGR